MSGAAAGPGGEPAPAPAALQTGATPPAATPAPLPPDAEAPSQRRDRLLAALVLFSALYTCALAQVVLVPIVIAILLGLMLAPAVRLLERWHVPRVLGALAVTLAFFTALAAVLLMLAAPAREWLGRLPTALAHMQDLLQELRRPLQMASEAGKKLGELASLDEAAPVRLVDASSGFVPQALSAAPALVTALVIVLFLTFLFLLHGDVLLRKFVTLAPDWRSKRDLVQATRQAQHELSLYMLTISLINAGLGVATMIALYLLGMPDPWLWGGVAALLNFAPFVGPLATAILLVVAGFAEFSTPWQALAAPGAFLFLQMLEGQLITPHLVGHRLALDPVMVFLVLILLGWMWGVAGLLLAVPLISCIKLIATRIPEAAGLAILLSRQEPG